MSHLPRYLQVNNFLILTFLYFVTTKLNIDYYMKENSKSMRIYKKYIYRKNKVIFMISSFEYLRYASNF